MSTLHKNASLSTSMVDGASRILQQWSATIRRVHKARQARSVTHGLLAHDDRMLKDIGLTRGDVEQALTVNWDQDPAFALAEIRNRRMQGERQGIVASPISQSSAQRNS